MCESREHVRGFSVKTELEKIVKDELSGQAAKSYVAEITRFHRVQASTMLARAREKGNDRFQDCLSFSRHVLSELGRLLFLCVED